MPSVRQWLRLGVGDRPLKSECNVLLKLSKNSITSKIRVFPTLENLYQKVVCGVFRQSRWAYLYVTDDLEIFVGQLSCSTRNTLRSDSLNAFLGPNMISVIGSSPSGFRPKPSVKYGINLPALIRCFILEGAPQKDIPSFLSGISKGTKIMRHSDSSLKSELLNMQDNSFKVVTALCTG